MTSKYFASMNVEELRREIRHYRKEILERKLWMANNDHWWSVIKRQGLKNVFIADFRINECYNIIDRICIILIKKSLPKTSFNC